MTVRASSVNDDIENDAASYIETTFMPLQLHANIIKTKTYDADYLMCYFGTVFLKSSTR